VTDSYVGERLAVWSEGRLTLTPLAIALVAVESTDLMFAIDSIPAIFAITEDSFLVFSSNVFAILGLRSLYFALADMMNKLHYLKLTLAVLLALVGVKMLLKDVLHAVPGVTYYTLGVVAAVLAIGIVASLIRARFTQSERPNKDENAVAT
jgi:tellurite resistance protein TerC